METRRLQHETLWSVLLLMVLAAVLPAQQTGEEEEAEMRRRREGIVARIPKPENRDAIAGTFEMVGKTIEVSEGELYDKLVLLTRLEGGVVALLSR